MPAGGEHARRRDRRRRVERLQVAGEPASDGQALGPVVGLGMLRQPCPGDREITGRGMRVGEAVGLDRDDVDLQAGVITIRHAKFDRTRMVPPHPTVTEVLSRYAAERDRLGPRPR